MHFFKNLLPAIIVAPTLASAFGGHILDNRLALASYRTRGASPAPVEPPCEERDVDPSAPPLTYLYTAYLECGPAISTGGVGPKGTRSVIPIVGGNFTGPRIKGTIANLGADWALIDAENTLYADSRSNLVTDDGTVIYLQQSGTGGQGNGRTFLRMVFETGNPGSKYYWLNKVVAIGTLTFEKETPGGGSIFKIQAFMMAN